jgi:hypothetical protein
MMKIENNRSCAPFFSLTKAYGCLSGLILVFLSFTQASSREAVVQGARDAAFDLLLPAPHEVEVVAGHVLLRSPIKMSVPKQWEAAAGRHLWLLNEVLQLRGARPVVIAKDAADAAIRLVGKKEGGLPENGYELKIGNGIVELAAPDAGGVFNGLATLAQLIEVSGEGAIQVPNGQIRDWPELPTRAVHIDMTCQQYKAPYVRKLMRMLARYKINAILMEYSDMFPFREHKAICRPDAFSEAEIQAIRRTAEECNQEIIPCLQCAGHLKYVLTREPYAALSKGHGGYSYCLTNEAVLPFAESLIDEIVAQHPGLKRLHVGGDEVGPGRCERCAASDFHAVYLKHYAAIAEHCRKRGVAPLMWTDIIAPFRRQSNPETLARLARQAAQVLPHEVIGVDWHYGLTEYYVAPKLRELGMQAFTAPAARSSGDFFDLPRLMLHMRNVQIACLRAVKCKLAGTIVTSWSYRGSPHEVCLPAYAASAYGWNSREGDVPALLGRFFRQRYGLSETAAAALAQAALVEAKQDVATTLASPLYDIRKQAWTMSAAQQAKQLIAFAGEKDFADVATSLENELHVFAANEALWQSALQNSARFQSELRCWDLSRRHATHRLELARTLMRLRAGNDVDQQVAALNEARVKLRDEWKDNYRDVYTLPFMEVDLGLRFDAEPGIVKALRQWDGTRDSKKGKGENSK